MKKISVSQCAELLKNNDNYLILTHRNPDGDTLGSGFALHRILSQMGKKSFVRCIDTIHNKYSYLWDGIENNEIPFDKIIAVDVADTILLGGDFEAKYGDKIFLCIDHHMSNKEYAENLLLQNVAATTEIIYKVAEKLSINFDKGIADCIYTGLSTDTGCFMFSNTTPDTHRIGAKMMEFGADYVMINRAMFETKSMSYMRLEQMALEKLKMYFNGICAVMILTQEMFHKSGSNESECDGIAGLPRKIEGVLIGVTIRERTDGTYKVSLRTNEPFDAAKICMSLGGGGHIRAAGCEFDCSLDETLDKVLKAIEAEII